MATAPTTPASTAASTAAHTPPRVHATQEAPKAAQAPGEPADAPDAPVINANPPVYSTPVPAPEDHPEARAKRDMEERHAVIMARLNYLRIVLKDVVSDEAYAELERADKAADAGDPVRAATALAALSWSLGHRLTADDLATLNAAVTELRDEAARVPAK
jgi:hypothetical protein